MPAARTETRAIELIRQFELAGHVVRKVVIDGKRIEVEFDGDKKPDALDDVKW